MTSSLFKKFTLDEDVQTQSKIKSSATRAILRQIEEQYPMFANEMETILPKKSMTLAKCKNHVNIVLNDKTPIMFNVRDGPYFPSLKMLHKYPDILPRMQIDKGGIRFIMNGADVMCPGLTSKGGCMADVPAGAIVGVFAEGKEHAMAVGITKMSTADIRSKNKGIGIETVHFLNECGTRCMSCIFGFDCLNTSCGYCSDFWKCHNQF